MPKRRGVRARELVPWLVVAALLHAGALWVVSTWLWPRPEGSALRLDSREIPEEVEVEWIKLPEREEIDPPALEDVETPKKTSNPREPKKPTEPLPKPAAPEPRAAPPPP
ncbi:MAG: hypothetical protein HY698_05295, partial [Deltaproteobacteria bacterium]|nr:hypothetical protein [Deltaproteobacteria bacterium]